MSKVSAKLSFPEASDAPIRVYFEQVDVEGHAMVEIRTKDDHFGFYKIERFGNGKLGRNWVRDFVSETPGIIVEF